MTRLFCFLLIDERTALALLNVLKLSLKNVSKVSRLVAPHFSPSATFFRY